MNQPRSQFRSELAIIPTVAWIIAFVAFVIAQICLLVLAPRYIRPFRNTPDAGAGGDQHRWWHLPGHRRPDGRLCVRRLQASRHEFAAVDAIGNLHSQGARFSRLLSAAQTAAGAVSQMPVADRIGFHLLPEMWLCTRPSLRQLRPAHPARLYVLPVLREARGSSGLGNRLFLGWP